jgi:CHAT domain-containing protein
MLDSQSPRLLHIASHGFFLPDADAFFCADFIQGEFWIKNNRPVLPANPLLYGGLALAGANGDDGARVGLATAYEMQGMNLRNTELVSLSACETGIGGVTIGGGVRGLRQVILQSGARRLVSSLWKVPDKETADLMADFYKRLLKGETAASALRNAALYTRAMRLENGNPAAHPFFWGAFVLIGDPGKVVLK